MSDFYHLIKRFADYLSSTMAVVSRSFVLSVIVQRLYKILLGVYVANHFCDSVRLLSGSKFTEVFFFFIVCLYLYFHWISNYQEREGWDAIYRFNHTTFLFQTRSLPYIVIFFVFNDLRWEVVIRFCWYLWNCWPSLFKLTFQNCV